ncbi:MAG: PilZ domain-containing protein [Planctomycetota bacterium]
MARLQELDLGQINDALQSAVEKVVPLTVTVRHDGRWVTLRSRFVAIEGSNLRIEIPQEFETDTPWEFAPADKIALSFKLKHYKHLASATVVGVEQMELVDGQTVPVLCLCAPTKMQRAQRRAYLRADVPDGRIVRASFWLGGVEAEPVGSEPDTPVWSATVGNISAGGVQVRASQDVADAVDVGETVGMHVSFGPGQGSIRADAQFRHAEPVDGEGVLMGFQFLGLEASDEGKDTLMQIARKVSELRADGTRQDRRRARA